MQVAPVAALSLLLAAPTLVPGEAHFEPGELTSTKETTQRVREAHGILLRHARAVGEQFLGLSSPEELDAALLNSLGDEALLARLDAFDRAFHDNVRKLSSQPTDRKAMARLIGVANADRILSPTLLDEACKKVYDRLGAELVAGRRRPALSLLWVPPREAVMLPDPLKRLVLARWKGNVASITLIYAVLGDKVIRGWLADTLCKTIAQGKRAALVLLASLDVPVPEEIIPATERVDLQPIFRQARQPGGRGMSWIEDASSFVAPSPPAEVPSEGALLPADLAASSWEEPDLDAVETTLRAALLAQGKDPDEILRRATESVRRAYERKGEMTDEDIQRAASWVLGRA